MNTEEKPAATLGKFARARGGKERVRFKDVLGNACVLETSGNGSAPGAFSIRLGVEQAQPKIQALDARALGMTTTQKTGLIKYPIPDEVRIDTTAVLARNQVSELVTLLVRWLKRGTFEDHLDADVLLSLPPEPLPKTEAQKTVDRVIQGLKTVDKLQKRAQEAGDRRDGDALDQLEAELEQEKPSEEEQAREEAAEFALNAQLEDDGVPPELREPYQERRRKGEVYRPRNRGEIVE